MSEFPDSRGMPPKLGLWLAKLSSEVRSVSRFRPQTAREDFPLLIAEVRYCCVQDDELDAALDAVEHVAGKLIRAVGRARGREDDASIEAAREAARMSLVELKPILAAARPSTMAQSLGLAWHPSPTQAAAVV